MLMCILDFDNNWPLAFSAIKDDLFDIQNHKLISPQTSGQFGYFVGQPVYGRSQFKIMSFGDLFKEK